jgi:hypothetical protein
MSSTESLKNFSTSENTSTSDNNQPTVQSYSVICASCSKKEVIELLYEPGISHVCNDCFKNLKRPILYRIHAGPGVRCGVCNELFNIHHPGSGGQICNSCYETHK